MNARKENGSESRICSRQNKRSKGNAAVLQNVITAELWDTVDCQRRSARGEDFQSGKVHVRQNTARFRKWRDTGVFEAVFQALADGYGNRHAFLLSSGNVHDSKYGDPLLSQFDMEGSNILGR